MNNRRSIRIKDYDYSQNNYYFITICSYKAANIFGKLSKEKIVLNSIGVIAQNCLIEIPEHFSNVIIDEHIIMPNHIHVIVIVNDDKNSDTGTIYRAPTKIEKFGVPKSGTLSRIVSSYKAAVTRKVKQQSIGGYDKIWQRNYYEHVIRNDKELLEIRKYIKNNPIAWYLENKGL
jgi:REP element-mobilizing transposase RayT